VVGGLVSGGRQTAVGGAPMGGGGMAIGGGVREEGKNRGKVLLKKKFLKILGKWCV
jgi:hypothetical protein